VALIASTTPSFISLGLGFGRQVYTEKMGGRKEVRRLGWPCSNTKTLNEILRLRKTKGIIYCMKSHVFQKTSSQMCIRHFYKIISFAIICFVGVILGLALRRKTVIIVDSQMCVLSGIYVYNYFWRIFIGSM
jgi:hypothetical protein